MLPGIKTVIKTPPKTDLRLTVNTHIFVGHLFDLAIPVITSQSSTTIDIYTRELLYISEMLVNYSGLVLILQAL